jgi:hypothetical protein
LRLRIGPLSDEGLAVIGRAVRLEELDLSGGYFGPQNFSDAGLSSLAGLKRLKTLDLWGVDIGDEGIAHIARLTSLQELHVTVGDASGDGIRQLGKLTSLRRLTLDGFDRTIPPGGLSGVLEALILGREEVRQRANEEEAAGRRRRGADPDWLPE